MPLTSVGVVVYHIAGCGVCEECRHGYMIGCTSPLRAAHGWQRDGGHAEFLLAEEATCILLPGELSYVDRALVSWVSARRTRGCSAWNCPDKTRCSSQG
jgi:threonine dehydrogenase-like Zn-dependent dehydrogenase